MNRKDYKSKKVRSANTEIIRNMKYEEMIQDKNSASMKTFRRPPYEKARDRFRNEGEDQKGEKNE